jgi:uncharacterized protein (UPF0147 family)
MMKARERKILNDLIKKPRVPRAIKKAHYDIEDAIAERGGERGKLRHAEA